jgi:hypothetical protein
MPFGQAEHPVASRVVSGDLECRRRPRTVFEGMLNMCAELAFEFLAKKGLNLGLAKGPTSFNHLVYARLHNRKPGREKRRALTREAWIGRLQGERYRLGDNISEMDAAAKDIPAVAAADMGNAAHGF